MHHSQDRHDRFSNLWQGFLRLLLQDRRVSDGPGGAAREHLAEMVKTLALEKA